MKRALLIVCALFSAVGCSRTGGAAEERCVAADAGTPVDPLLLAFLSRARAAHHVADDQESAGDLLAATTPLTQLLQGPLPPPLGNAEHAPEVREVLADSYARLADLRSRLGAFEQALSDVRAGLTQARDANYFRGHLLETEGLIEERHAKALESQDPQAAAALRQRAIGLLEQAMEVQSHVLQAVPTRSAAPAQAGSSHDSAARP